MAGKKTWSVGPYDEVVTAAAGIDSDIGDETDLWVDDTNSHACWDNDESWTQDYYFRVWVGHNTPSDLYVHDSVTSASVTVTYSFRSTVDDATCDIQVYDITAAGWVSIGELTHYDSDRGSIDTHTTFTIPAKYIDRCVDATGIAKIRFNVTWVSNTAYLYVYYIKFNITCDTTGYSTAMLIDDTLVATGPRLKVDTDLTAAATRVWEGIPYCIAQKIYLHLEAATGPILGYDTMVTLTAGAANIENTSGISTRQYVDKTPLEIIQDLARQDKAHFWAALGTATVTYQSTFAAGAADETLTDADLNTIHSTFDWSTATNEVTAYGMRIGDQRLTSTYTDATSEAKYKATRTRVVSDPGMVSEQDTLARATAIVNQYKDVQQILTATIRGNVATAAHAKTILLSDEIQITSTYLGLTDAWYIVQRLDNISTLLLHPRVSATGLQADERPSFEMAMSKGRRGTADTYIPAPSDDTI
jgi:hypothetical protein